jgi:hypothetical protein
MKVIVTKDAVTSGVFAAEGHTCDNINPDMFQEDSKSDYLAGWHSTYHGDDWHKTKETAVAKVNEMFAKKRKSLEKALAGLAKKQKIALDTIAAADLTPEF